jgi:hypothetical protein
VVTIRRVPLHASLYFTNRPLALTLASSVVEEQSEQNHLRGCIVVSESPVDKL